MNKEKLRAPFRARIACMGTQHARAVYVNGLIQRTYMYRQKDREATGRVTTTIFCFLLTAEETQRALAR
jgi:hypothetical protein